MYYCYNYFDDDDDDVHDKDYKRKRLVCVCVFGCACWLGGYELLGQRKMYDLQSFAIIRFEVGVVQYDMLVCRRGGKVRVPTVVV